jgi:hypothetical protein
MSKKNIDKDLEQLTEYMLFVFDELLEESSVEGIKHKIEIVKGKINDNPQYYFKDGLKAYINDLFPSKPISPKLFAMLKSINQSTKLRIQRGSYGNV